MAQTIVQIKRSLGNGIPGNLRPGEFAYSAAETGDTGTSEGVLYIGGPTADGQGYARNKYVIGGTKYTTLLDVTPGQVTAGKAIVADANGGVAQLNGVKNEGTGETTLVLGNPDTPNQKVVIHDPYVIGEDGSQQTLKEFIDEFVKSGVFTFTAGPGIAEIVNENGTYTIGLAATGVVAGSYGSETKIPAITVNEYGQLTSVEEKTISTTLNVSNTDGTVSGSVDLLNGKLVGGDGTQLDVATEGQVTVGVDATVVRTSGAQSIAGAKEFATLPTGKSAQTDVKAGEASDELVKLDTLWKQLINQKGKTTKSAGGIGVGTDLSNKSVLEIFADMLYSYQATTNVRLTAATPAGGTFEVGDIKAVSTATVAWNVGSTQVTKAEVLSGGVVKGTATVSSGSSVAVPFTTAMEVGSAAGTVTITGKVYDDEGTKPYTGGSISWTHVYPYYYGGTAAVPTTSAEITGLIKSISTKGNKQFSFNLNNEFMVFAYPASYGKLSSIKDPVGNDMTGSFTKTTINVTGLDGKAIAYNVYTQNNASTASGYKPSFNY